MIPVITIDGPSGVGKGTLAHQLAKHLKWHYLDSGALYRVLALAAKKHNLSDQEESQLATLATQISIEFAIDDNDNVLVMMDSNNVTTELRREDTASFASQISAFPAVRANLLQRQKDFRQAPGLVTDGRDMGTVVFPDANVKFFLTATSEERAKRRAKQLMQNGISVNLTSLIAEITERDKRDANRVISPLKPAADGIVIDTTHLDQKAAFEKALEFIRQAGL